MATLSFLIDVKAPDASRTFGAVAARLDELDRQMKATRDIAVSDKTAQAAILRAQLAADKLRDRVTKPMDMSLRGAQAAEARLLELEASADRLNSKLKNAGGPGFLSRIAGGVRGGLGSAATGIATGAATASGAAAAGIGLAGAAVGIAAPLAAGGLALGAFAALAVPTLSKVSGALSATGKAGQKAWSQLDPAQRGIATSIKSLEGTFGKAARAFEPVVSSVVRLGARTAQDLLPAITKLAPAGAKVIDGFLAPLDGLLKSPFFASFTSQMSVLAAQVGPVLGKAMTQLLQVFMKMFMQAGPAGVDMLKNLLPLIVNIGDGLVPVVTAGAKFVDWITKMAARSPAVATGLLAVGAAVAVATGGLTVIIPAVLALAGWLVHLWQTSQKFRDIVTSVFTVVAKSVLTFAEEILTGLQIAANVFLDTVGVIVHGAAAALGWVPGVGPKLKAAAKAFDGFHADVNNVFNSAHATIEGWKASLDKMPKVVRLKGNISDLQSKLATARKSLADPHLTATKRAVITANITRLQAQVDAAKLKLAQLQDKTVTVTAHIAVRGDTTLFNGMAFASGTPAAPPGWAWTGERGPELVKFRGGETVLPHGASMRVARGFADGTFRAGQLIGVGGRGPELVSFDKDGRVFSPEQSAALIAAANKGSDGGSPRGPLISIGEAHFHDEADLSLLEQKLDFAIVSSGLGA